MAIVDDFTLAVPAHSRARSRLAVIRAGLGAFARALSAGMRAAAEYHQLNQLSDRQLRLRGLSRSDIPREIHQHHFASLGGWLDVID